MFGDLRLDFSDASERVVPPCLQFPCHETIGGVGSIILAKGAVRSIACCLKISHERFIDLIAPVRHFSLRRQSCSNRSRFDHLQECRIDSIIDPQSAEGDTAWLPVIESTSVARIAWNAVLHPRIADRQFATAAATANQTSEQRIAMLGGSVMSARWNVVAHHLADRLRALPIHVAIMGSRLQCQPLRAQLAPAAYLLTCTNIARRNSGLTIGIGTPVDGVGYHAVDGSVARSAPSDIAVVPLRR